LSTHAYWHHESLRVGLAYVKGAVVNYLVDMVRRDLLTGSGVMAKLHGVLPLQLSVQIEQPPPLYTGSYFAVLEGIKFVDSVGEAELFEESLDLSKPVNERGLHDNDSAVLKSDSESWYLLFSLE